MVKEQKRALDVNGDLLQVGDMVRKVEFGPNAEPRKVLQVGDQQHTAGFIVVAGLLGWQGAKRFRKVTGEP